VLHVYTNTPPPLVIPFSKKKVLRGPVNLIYLATIEFSDLTQSARAFFSCRPA
jgi:hypothetical protein